MKVLHTADWHIGNFPGPEKNGKNLRAEDLGKCIEKLLAVAEDEKPDVIIVAGDIFHQARVWADRGLSEVTDAIRYIECLSRTAPVVVLRGTPNHDGEEQFNLLAEHFEGDEAVSIVTKPEVIVVALKNGEFADIACLPGFDRGEFRAKFPGLSKEEENVVFTQELGNIVMGLRASCIDGNAHILVAHYTVPGCNTESGQTPFMAQFEPVIMPDVLDAADFDLVCLGHIHRPQMLPVCGDKIFYSGALNAMNFNDEGQKRGFYIHNIVGKDICSNFYSTPIREFKTLMLNNEDISNFNLLGGVTLSSKLCDLEGKIVRVIYSCNEDENKAFNRAAFERELYDTANVFWVSEIVPDNITLGTNKKELTEANDPEANLFEYLKEKALDAEEIAEIILMARPIISEAIAGNNASKLTGMFVPLEIEVKNYRNYIEESFSFKDVTFCTINGKNGAGKSSLFMDAILDALYEEPREGELTAWIRADEKARSGSISFTFAIGDKTFRVVRTRAKSGKATLNLSEMVNGEWENRSCEKYKDTQDRIIEILGMDSLTFRSCALIMQDQYGLFLQADKEARMAILGNILGLGIYGDMESISKAKLSDCNREITISKHEVTNLQDSLSKIGDPEKELEETEGEISRLSESMKPHTASRDKLIEQLISAEKEAEQYTELSEKITHLIDKGQALSLKLNEQDKIIDEVNIALACEGIITDMVKALADYEEKERQMIGLKATVDEKTSLLKEATLAVDIASRDERIADEKITGLTKQISDVRTQIATLKGYASYVAEYEAVEKQILDLEAKEARYRELSDTLHFAERNLESLKRQFDIEASKRKSRLTELERQTTILESCNCLDIDKAECQFLADAKRAKAEIEPYRAECTKWKEGASSDIEVANNACLKYKEDIINLGYDPLELTRLRQKLKELEVYKRSYDTIPGFEAQLEQLEIRKADAEKDKAEALEHLKDAQRQKAEAEAMLEEYGNFTQEYAYVTGRIKELLVWREKEKELPLLRHKKEAAIQRSGEISTEIATITAEIETLREHRNSLDNNEDKIKVIKEELACEEITIEDIQKKIDDCRVRVGVLTKTIEDYEATNEAIRAKQKSINEAAALAARYEILKNAFSRDGIPHNIIRTIIPVLTATSNTILGQMTGGKMGMQFVTDKVLKSNKKEVATLDIVIEEYGKDTLPYLSKSGGEKVKSSLSAILSLTEIKSTQAGIQLGMLFIDEPPFLDDEGTQAYCDALETIQSRYKDLKIMAITHDPTFKARFPQNLDVVKTENGSKVIFD